MFVPRLDFQPSLMFASKAGICPQRMALREEHLSSKYCIGTARFKQKFSLITEGALNLEWNCSQITAKTFVLMKKIHF